MARIRNQVWTVALLTAALTLPLPALSASHTVSTSANTATVVSKEKAVKVKTKKTARKVTRKTTRVSLRSVERSKVIIAGKTETVTARIRHASFAPTEIESGDGSRLSLRSSVAFVQDLSSSDVLFAKNDATVTPIASITKLMTALVVVDSGEPMDQMIEVTTDDIDKRKFTTSRLKIGTELSRTDMLHLALMSSENRAANALGRNYPGGLSAFVAAMNAKAASLGMHDTHYVEPTGLSSENVSSARDLVRLMQVAATRPLIHQYTTATSYDVDIGGRRQTFRNTNQLVSKPDWGIVLSKTGFINEAGRCLIMMAKIGGRDLAIVLLDSVGSFTRTADAVRVRKWLQHEDALAAAGKPAV